MGAGSGNNGGAGREAVLRRIRGGLRRGPLQGEQRASLDARLRRPPRHLVPARAQLPAAGQVDLFVEMARQAQASVARVSAWRDVPAAVADYLLRCNLPTDRPLVLAPAAELLALPWQAQPRLQVEARAARGDDRIGVGLAAAGVAETGTLLMCSGPASPSVSNFLPDVHIVVLPAGRVVGPYEDAFERLRGRPLSRTVNLITGPSRSADIEQTLQLGAHGPVQLHIVLVDDAGPPPRPA